MVLIRSYDNSIITFINFFLEDPRADLCGIVFVERRNTAAFLCEQLNILSEKDEDFAFVKCDYVVGHGMVSSPAAGTSADMNWKQQEKILRKFRQHEINLLIATSVVEEGLDVPKCNLVVRFDFPKTYQSYVQSKGRARAKDSKYVILISEEDPENDGYFQVSSRIYTRVSSRIHIHTRIGPSLGVVVRKTPSLPFSQK